jgi:hypothetical protein
MTKNMGTADRAIRAVVGIALIGWGIYAHNWLGAIGVVLLGTALVSWCPAYLPFGIRTNK